jgi:hypothetical protein
VEQELQETPAAQETETENITEVAEAEGSLEGVGHAQDEDDWPELEPQNEEDKSDDEADDEDEEDLSPAVCQSERFRAVVKKPKWYAVTTV